VVNEERSRRDSELLYGRNAVIETLRGRRTLRRLYAVEGIERQPRVEDALRAARERDLPITRLTRQELDRLLKQVNHQGLALETGRFPYVSLKTLLQEASQRTILALDHLQDTQNLATLIRTAEASGSAGLILPEYRAAGITPAVVNASAGAVEHVPVARVTNLARVVEQCKHEGYWAVALELAPAARTIFETKIPRPVLLIVGSEGKGISPVVLKHSDLQVSLPMLGTTESLNAAVAGSIALYELLRRQREEAD
jgi:23S rRNA (guanosine2251-2'-O)-methyltransferase